MSFTWNSPAAVETTLPLQLKPSDHVVFIGNTLFDRGAQFPYFEAMLQQAHPAQKLVVRTLAWSADEVDLMPRPDNFGTLNQHLMVQQADVIFAAFGFNESFAGAERIATKQDPNGRPPGTLGRGNRLQHRAPDYGRRR